MKHPVLVNRNRLLIWWLVWLVFGAGQSLLFYFAYGSQAWVSIADSIVAVLTYSGVALALWYPLRFFNSSRKNMIPHVANLAAMGLITVFLWMMITRNVTGLILPPGVYPEFWNNTFTYRVGTGVFIYAMIILSYYLFISLANLSEKNAREARLEALVKETELKMLRSQINPHFLFNSLNSISSLTVTDPEKARTMVIKLSDFMRYGLTAKNEQTVPLAGELENLRLYLDIEKVRFGNRLVTEERINDECLRIPVPVMLLQPLYENAVKHGVFGSTGPVRIDTSVSMTNEYLQITIANSFEDGSPEKKGTGTGLLNVSRRLELYYGNMASMKTFAEDGMFKVNIFIPAGTVRNEPAAM